MKTSQEDRRELMTKSQYLYTPSGVAARERSPGEIPVGMEVSTDGKGRTWYRRIKAVSHVCRCPACR